MNRFQAVAIIPLVGLISACGGGGDSSPDTSARQAAPQVDQRYVFVPEASTTAIGGDFENTGSFSVSGTENLVRVVLAEDRQRLIIDAPDVNQPRTLELLLKFEGDNQPHTFSLSVHVENTSALELETRVTDTLREKERLLDLEQDQVLFHFFVDLAYLNQLITHSDKQQYLDGFDPASATSYTEANATLQQLDEDYQRYQAADLTDAELELSLSRATRQIEIHSDYGAGKLAEIQSYTSLIAPTFDGDLRYSPEAGFYSRYVDNDTYSEPSGDGFTLKPPYDALATVIRTEQSQEIRCEDI